MPLLDHFHPPLHGPRRWEGFHHAWAAVIAMQLNADLLPKDWFAESEITIGPTLEIDVATMRGTQGNVPPTSSYVPARPRISARTDFSRLEGYEIHVYQDLGGAELRAAIELIGPANKDREGARITFAAKCAGYLRNGVSLVIVDVVTSRSANLHAELFDVLEATGRRTVWESPTGLYAAAYRPVPLRGKPRIEVWPETLTLGEPLPVMPLWLTLELCLPLRLEESYSATCRALRIPA